MRPEAIDRLTALVQGDASPAEPPIEPNGTAEQSLRGDNVTRLSALVQQHRAAQEPGYTKQLLGAAGRGALSVAQIPLALRAAMGDANMAAPLALTEQLKQGTWSGSMADPFNQVASTYANEPWYTRLHNNIGAAFDNPGAALLTAAESAPQMIPQSAAMLGGGALGSLLAPGAGTAAGSVAGLGAMSALQDFTSEYLQAFQSAGVNTADPAALYAATLNPNLRMKAAASAAAHGLAVGTFDALTAGLSQKLKPLMEGVTEGMSRASRAALPRAADMVTQGLGGSAGELAGQLAQGRDTLDTNAITMEFVAEVVQGLGESAASTTHSRRPRITADNAEAWARLNPEAAAELAAAKPTRDAWDKAGLDRMTEKDRAAVHQVLQQLMGDNPGNPGSADAGLPSTSGSQGPAVTSAEPAPASPTTTTPTPSPTLPAMTDPTADHPATERLYGMDDWPSADLSQAVDALASDKDPSEITANDSKVLAWSARDESLPVEIRTAAAELLNASPYANDFPSIDAAQIAESVAAARTDPPPSTPPSTPQETANGQEAQAQQAQVLNDGANAAAADTTPDVSPAVAGPSDPAAAVSAPTPTPPKRKPGKGFFTKSDLESRIVHAEADFGTELAAQNNLEDAGGGTLGVTFYKKLPTELKEAISGRTDLLRVFRVTQNAADADGADALSALGVDRYVNQVDQAFGGRRIDRIKGLLRTSPDPQHRFLAALHDNLPQGKTPPKVKVDPGTLPVGTKFRINGSDFEVIRGEASDGWTLLKDGEDFPIVPAQALDPIGVDKGTLTKGKGLTPQQLQSAADQNPPSLPPTQSDLLGNPLADAATGSQPEMAFATEGRTPDTAPTNRSGADAAIANRYDETATEPLMQDEAGDSGDTPKGSDGIDLPFRTAQPGAVLDDSWRGPVPPVATSSSTRPAVLSAQWLTKWLSSKFDVPIRYGDLGRKAAQALGWYRARDQVIRVRGNAWGNLWVAGHEVAHHLERTQQMLSKLSAPAISELATLDYDTQLAASGQGRPTEGFAEYLARWWLGEGADLAVHAPNFTAEFFGSILPKNAATEANVKAFGDHVAAYFAQSAVARFRASISPDQKGTTGDVDQQSAIARAKAAVKKWHRSFVLNWSDAGYDITALDWHLKNANASADIPLEHIYRNANRAAASSGLDAFMKGAFHMSTGQAVRTTPGFEHVMSLLKDKTKYDDMRDFWVARHALEVIDAGIAQPFRRADLVEIVDRLGKDPDVVAAADALVQMANGLIGAMVDAKQISYKTAAAVQGKWKHYAPLLKVREDSFGEDPWKGLRKVGTPALKRLKGSQAQVIDPIAALAWRYLSTYQVLHRADVTNSLIDALKKSPPELQRRYLETGFDPKTRVTSFSLEEIKSTLVQMGMKPAMIKQIINDPTVDSTMALYRPDYLSRLGEPGMVLRYNGNTPEIVRLNSDLTAAVQSIAPYSPEMLVSILRGFTKVQRFGAVMTNLGFTLTNPIRDYGTYQWQGPGTLVQRLYQPPAEALRLLGRKAAALAGVEIPDPVRDLFESMHASPHQGAVGYQPDAARIKEILGGVGKPGVLRKIPTAPKWLLKQVVSLNEAMESIPRLAAFRNVLTANNITADNLRKGVLPSKKTLLAASQAAADSTVDFSRAGRQRWLGQTLLFANAIIQSNARFLRNFSSADAFWHAAPAMALQLAATLLYWVDKKDEDWWKNADKNLKYFFWVFADKDGREWLRLPMSYETGAYFSGTALALLDGMENKDPSIPWRFVLNTLGRNIAKPSAVMPLADVYANWDSFRDKPIVPRGQQDDPAYTQYGPQTTRVARGIGSLINYSPSKIDYLIDGYTGGLFRRLVRPVEKLATGEKFTGRDIPFFSNVTFAQHWDGSQELFTELVHQAKDKAQRATDAGRTVGIEHERLHELQRFDTLINDVRRQNKDVTGKEEREAFEKYLIGLRRRALGFEELKRFPDPIRHPPEDPSVRKAVEHLIGVEADAATNPMPHRKSGEPAAKYTERVKEWNLRRQQAHALLDDLGWTPAEVRKILMQRNRQQGRSSALTDPTGKPTALGERVRRLQLESAR